MFNPGTLKDRIKVLSIGLEDNNYRWIEESPIWSKAEYTGKKNIFSNFGYGEKQIKFFIRKRNLSLHNAFIWQNKHCIITDILEVERRYMEVNCAIIEPKECRVTRCNDTTQLDEYNRPIDGEEDYTITFPSIMVEKYIKQTAEEPMSTVESVNILITPKVIVLINGEIVNIQGIDYEVLVSHTLDEYKNEYEIRVRKES